MGTVKVVSQVKYGRKFNYPANHEAEQFCLLIPRSGRENDFAKSLTDRQLEIIKGLGFEVEQTVETLTRRARAKRMQPAVETKESRALDSIAKAMRK